MAGTCAEYDWNTSPIDETTLNHAPHSLYGSCKLALHLVLESFAKQMGVSHAWGRIFYLFGPYENAQRFVPAIIRGLLRRSPSRALMESKFGISSMWSMLQKLLSSCWIVK